MKYTWLLFDADDTLLDFPRAEANALRGTLEQSGLPFRPKYFLPGTFPQTCNISF